MMRFRVKAPSFVSSLVLVALTVHCADESLPAPSASSVAPSPLASSVAPPPEVPMPLATVRTTSPSLALGNLEGQVKVAEKKLREAPTVAHKAQLFGLLLQRFQISGALADYSRALELADLKLEDKPEFEAVLLRARGLSAAHKFAEALVELERAKALAPKEQATLVMSRKAAVLLAVGRYDEALELAMTVVRLEPTMSSLADQAVIVGAMGGREPAEALFVQAEQLYRGVSPFAISQLYFDRASMFERAGDLTTATTLFRAANKRLPSHVHVATHLAPLLSPSEGVAILEALGAVEEPDVLAQLGVLKNMTAAKSGDALIARASALYDAAMAKHPEAFADHAGWFWINGGSDPAKALSAAKLNLSLRKTADAYELMLAAAEAAKETALLCETKASAAALKWKTLRLESRLSTVGVACAAASPAPSASASAGAPK
jgi:tetratricopeptide (TPR) repeat protein